MDLKARDSTRGLLDRRVIPLKGDLAIVARRLVWHGKHYVDIRFATVLPHGGLKYMKKENCAIRFWAKDLEEVMMALATALMEMREVKVGKLLEIESVTT